MKLDYKILWLDDNIDGFVDGEYIEELEKHLISNGFTPVISPFSNIEDFRFNLNDSFDLILTDYHLTESINGADIVNEIRGSEKSIMTEILFYTAKADLKDINKIDRISFLETNAGTDTHYRKVTSKTIELIDLTIKKFQNIVAMRGMIMHETSSLDEELSKMATKILKGELPEIKQKHPSLNFENIKNLFFESINSNTSEKNKKVSSKKINDILKDDIIFNASEKNKVLGYFIEELKKLDEQVVNFTSAYKDSIISVRNNFAHAELLTDDTNGRQYFKKGDFTFDDEKCKLIRQNIIKHKKNLDNLKEKLK